MKIHRFPLESSAWAKNVFGQSTVFTFGEKELSLAVLFEAPDEENYHMRGLEKAWEAATSAAFIHRQLPSEELIEKILTAINTAIKESAIILEGAVLLTENLRVHFSTTGQTGVLLIDNSSVNLVSSIQKSTDFTAVTSGEVDETDSVILAPSFLVDQLINLKKINLEKLSEYCRNEQTLVVAALQDSSPITVEEDFEEPLEVTPRVPVASKLKAVSGVAGSAISMAKNIKLPAVKFKIPKISLPRRLPPFQLSSLSKPINIIGILFFVIVLYYGSTVIRDRINAAKQAEQPPTTILSSLKETDQSTILNFLTSTFEYSQYNQLSSEDQSQFQQELVNRGITPLSVNVTQELPENIIDAGISGTSIYLLDSSGQLWKYDSSLQKIEQSGLIIEPQRLLVFKEDRILVTDATGNIWLYDGSATQPVSLPLPQTLSTGKKLLAKYSNNLYIHSFDSSQIFRISGFDRDIINPSLYSKITSTGLAELRDFSIPDSAIGLDVSGKLLQFSRSAASENQSTLTPSLTARFQANSSIVVHTDKRVLTTLPLNLSTKNVSFVLANEEPITTLLSNDKISHVIAGKKLYTVSN